VTWGMEDPAARARGDLSIQTEQEWDGRPRRRRPREGLWVLAFIVLAGAAIWFTLQREDEQAGKDPLVAVQRGEVVGLTGLSLARPVNLTPVLDEMKRRAGPDDRLLSLRVAPAAVTANLVSPAGDDYFLDAGVDGRVDRREFAETNRSSPSTLDDVAPADIRRAITTVARLSGLPPSNLDYLVLTEPGPGQKWFVRFTAPTVRDRDWVGQGDGRTLRRANAAPPARRPAPTARTTAIPAPDAPAGDLQRQLDIAECLLDAGSDQQAILGCLQ
jgi:hypothetical protein